MKDLRKENLKTVREAAEIVDRHPRTVRYWVRNGVSGVKLETVRIGYRLYTSSEALERFHTRMQRIN